MFLSIVIPTYGRDEVLCDTLRYLLAQTPPADEIVVVDQTADHGPQTVDLLAAWREAGAIRWLRHAPPGTVGAMNRGLLEARGELVLFLDDDIIPGAELVAAHRRAHAEHPEAWATVGQVLQPEDWDVPTEPTEDTEEKEGGAQAGSRPTDHTEDTEVAAGRRTAGRRVPRERGPRPSRMWEARSAAANTSTRSSEDPALFPRPSHPCGPCVPWAGPSSIPADSCASWAGSLTQGLRFPFNGSAASWVTNVMAGNLCVQRERALAVGGFDANFTPPVAYRFETEFAKRLVAAGGRIWFVPAASIRHLRARRGGTRSQGSHLNSASPVHGVGDYYFALRSGRGWERIRYMARRPFREVRTRFHLRHPWYIPVKLVGEMRAVLLALRLWREGPKLLPTEHTEYTENSEGGGHGQPGS
jgi:GT2 family glycosyltransferase